MTRTRATSELYDEAENSARRDGAPPPPQQAPPATIEQLLATQTQILQMLAANQGGRPAAHGPPQETTYADFAATHPPLFSETADPMEADHWLRTIESKFGLIRCTEFQKTLFAAQQLRGSAGAWWANYQATLPANHQVPWAEFRAAFRRFHIPEGLMKHKL